MKVFALNKGLTEKFIKLGFDISSSNILNKRYTFSGSKEDETWFLYASYVLKRIMRNEEIPFIVPKDYLSRFALKRGLEFLAYHYVQYSSELKDTFVNIRIIKYLNQSISCFLKL